MHKFVRSLWWTERFRAAVRKPPDETGHDDVQQHERSGRAAEGVTQHAEPSIQRAGVPLPSRVGQILGTAQLGADPRLNSFVANEFNDARLRERPQDAF